MRPLPPRLRRNSPRPPRHHSLDTLPPSWQRNPRPFQNKSSWTCSPRDHHTECSPAPARPSIATFARLAGLKKAQTNPIPLFKGPPRPARPIIAKVTPTPLPDHFHAQLTQPSKPSRNPFLRTLHIRSPHNIPERPDIQCTTVPYLPNQGQPGDPPYGTICSTTSNSPT